MRAVAHRMFKDQIYAQFARLGAAIASEKRLALLDLLTQAPRNVEALAEETEMSAANTSRHLQTLKTARFVETSRDENRAIYRLAGEVVPVISLVLGTVPRPLVAGAVQ